MPSLHNLDPPSTPHADLRSLVNAGVASVYDLNPGASLHLMPTPSTVFAPLPLQTIESGNAFCDLFGRPLYHTVAPEPRCVISESKCVKPTPINRWKQGESSALGSSKLLVCEERSVREERSVCEERSVKPSGERPTSKLLVCAKPSGELPLVMSKSLVREEPSCVEPLGELPLAMSGFTEDGPVSRFGLDKNPFLLEATHTRQIWLGSLTSGMRLNSSNEGLFAINMEPLLSSHPDLLERYRCSPSFFFVDMFYQKRFFKAKCKNQDAIDAIDRSWKAFCEDFVHAPGKFIDSFLKARHLFFTFDVTGIKIKIHKMCREANVPWCYVLAAYNCPVCLPGTVSVSLQEHDCLLRSSDKFPPSPPFPEIKTYVKLLARKYYESKATSTAQQDKSELLKDVHLDTLLSEIQRRGELSKRREDELKTENEKLKRSLKSRRLI